MATTSPYPMPLPTADLDTTWAFLEDGMDLIMMNQTGVSYAKYRDLYTVAYNYCTSSKMPSNSSEQSAAGRCLLLFIVGPVAHG
jgi:cullin 1